MTEGMTPTVSDPQAPEWGGLSWSGWQDFDLAHRGKVIPATPGIYRFRARDEPGLLYIAGCRIRQGYLAGAGEWMLLVVRWAVGVADWCH